MSDRSAAASRVCPHGVDLTQACYCQRCDDEDGTTDAVAAMANIGKDAFESGRARWQPHLERANAAEVEISRLKDALCRIAAVREFHVSAEVNEMRRIAREAIEKGASK